MNLKPKLSQREPDNNGTQKKEHNARIVMTKNPKDAVGSNPVTVYVTEEQKQLIHEKRKKTGRSISDIMRELLDFSRLPEVARIGNN